MGLSADTTVAELALKYGFKSLAELTKMFPAVSAISTVYDAMVAYNENQKRINEIQQQLIAYKNDLNVQGFLNTADLINGELPNSIGVLVDSNCNQSAFTSVSTIEAQTMSHAVVHANTIVDFNTLSEGDPNRPSVEEYNATVKWSHDTAVSNGSGESVRSRI